MKLCRRVMTLTVAAVLAAVVTASAQQPAQTSSVPVSVATPDALDALLADQVRADDANRKIVHDVLNRAEVRAVAAKAGLDLERARQAVSTLGGAQLQEVASQAQRVDSSLSGGASTVVISTTTIIIILLIVILLVVA